jgi:hypothetical protein
MADTIMVAYSFNTDKPLKVTAELKAITELVQKTKCKIDPHTNASQQHLEDRISLLGKDILIFHFAGHAGGASIELNDDFSEGMILTDMKVFSEIIALDARSLRLVFLNGCSTEDQSTYLREQGVPVVISTTLPLDDNYAFDFAKLFYEKFFNKEISLDVQKAFDNTLRSFKAKEVTQLFSPNGVIKNEALLHPAKRGNFKIGPNTPSEIYRIDGDPAVLAQTFADWQAESPGQQANLVTDLEKTKPLSGGLSNDDCYLLCDRVDQADAFRKILRAKVQGVLPDPNFIFVNGHNSDGIPELLQRFHHYILPEICLGYNSRLDNLRFPDADFFDIPTDEKKPLLHLEEIYREQLMNKTGQKFGDNTLLLLCHKIYKPFWSNGLESLFQYYLNDYSTIMRQQIGERIIVLFFLIHTDKPDQKETLGHFTELYKKLKTAFPERVEYFDKLPLIEEGDLMEWHGDVFQTSLDTNDYPIESTGMYFSEASKYMKKIIADHKRNA